LFPKDPRYQYYTGVCMVQANTDLGKAIEYLKTATDKSVPRDVYFFLGKAYHYQYRFDDALYAYLQFQQFGERLEKDKWLCDMHIIMARNGKKLLERQAVIDVHKAETVSKDELFGFYNKQLKSGQFKEKTEKAFLLSESKARTTCRFVPSFLAKGQEVYESSSSNFKKNRDIVVEKKLDNNNWSRPENLGSIINSPFDEDYAYFNMAESALYFSSKGHNSMGGYDIFKSLYNPNIKTWSEPVNLGFPINSPYDDILFVPSDDQSSAWFASNRDTKGDKFMIYSIGFSKEYTFVNLPSNADVASISRLTILSSKPVMPKVEPVARPKAETLTRPQPVIAHKPETITKQAKASPYPSELMEQKEYNEVLNAALQYQLKSDSLSRIAEDVRQNMQASKNEAEKSKQKREIYLLEQRSKTAQLKADELYDKARTYEIAYAGKTQTKSSYPQVSNEMVKNAFSTKEGKTPNTKDVKKQEEKKKPTKETKIAAKPIVNEFKIVSKTPYKSTSDIPLNKPLPDGLLYRIQMGAFSKTIEPDRFKGIVPINGETIQNSAVTKYYAGMFSKMTDAEKALNKIHEYGFKDAYIVSFFNGRYIPINRAKELEKDNW